MAVAQKLEPPSLPLELEPPSLPLELEPPSLPLELTEVLDVDPLELALLDVVRELDVVPELAVVVEWPVEDPLFVVVLLLQPTSASTVMLPEIQATVDTLIFIIPKASPAPRPGRFIPPRYGTGNRTGTTRILVAP